MLSRFMVSLFFFNSSVAHPYLHSFPTRRSSDLSFRRRTSSQSGSTFPSPSCSPGATSPATRNCALSDRSEEHTSELQSHVNLVCRLLLEKKKTCRTSEATCCSSPSPPCSIDHSA